jgi:hypothetical protein
MNIRIFLILSFFINENLIAVSQSENIASLTSKRTLPQKKSNHLSTDKSLKSNKNTKNKSFFKKYHKPIIIGLTITTVVLSTVLTYYVIKSLTQKEGIVVENLPAMTKLFSLMKSLSDESCGKLYNFFQHSQSFSTPIEASSSEQQQELQTILKQISLYNTQYESLSDEIFGLRMIFYPYSGFNENFDVISYKYEENHVKLKQ